MLSQQKDESCLGNKQTSTRLKERSNKKTSGGSNRCKFVGVRQRPSGKWVAEIKNTTQKIRIWLGTFHTAEEAARAYDEAACLLRGSNTRTNFVADYRGSGTNNSALSLKIRNLINQKKSCSLLHNQSAPAPAPTAAAPAPGTCVIKADYGNPSVWKHLTGIDSSSSSNDYSWVTGRPTAGFWLDAHTIGSGYERSVFNDGYRPDMSICNSNQLQSSTDQIFAAPGNSWPLTGGEESQQQQQQQQLLFPSTAADEAFDLHPETGNISLTSSEGGIDQSDIAEFERIKVERQISATLYAMNGVNDYLENVSATSDNSSSNVPSWDLPMFYQSFCLS